jgi:hypothetical protein
MIQFNYNFIDRLMIEFEMDATGSLKKSNPKENSVPTT